MLRITKKSPIGTYEINIREGLSTNGDKRVVEISIGQSSSGTDVIEIDSIFDGTPIDADTRKEIADRYNNELATVVENFQEKMKEIANVAIKELAIRTL